MAWMSSFLFPAVCFQCEMQGNEISKKVLFLMFSLSYLSKSWMKTFCHEMLIILKVFVYKISFLFVVDSIEVYSFILYYLYRYLYGLL